jgi:hypothetical protein
MAISPVDGQTERAALEPVKKYTVPKNFRGEKPYKSAAHLSGIACLPALPTGAIPCLVVNDENTVAQFATIEKDTLIAGPELPLIGNEADQQTLGRPPDVDCPNGDGGFKEFDQKQSPMLRPTTMSWGRMAAPGRRADSASHPSCWRASASMQTAMQ